MLYIIYKGWGHPSQKTVFLLEGQIDNFASEKIRYKNDT